MSFLVLCKLNKTYFESSLVIIFIVVVVIIIIIIIIIIVIIILLHLSRKFQNQNDTKQCYTR